MTVRLAANLLLFFKKKTPSIQVFEST